MFDEVVRSHESIFRRPVGWDEQTRRQGRIEKVDVVFVVLCIRRRRRRHLCQVMLGFVNQHLARDDVEMDSGVFAS